MMKKIFSYVLVTCSLLSCAQMGPQTRKVASDNETEEQIKELDNEITKFQSELRQLKRNYVMKSCDHVPQSVPSGENYVDVMSSCRLLEKKIEIRTDEKNLLIDQMKLAEISDIDQGSVNSEKALRMFLTDKKTILPTSNFVNKDDNFTFASENSPAVNLLVKKYGYYVRDAYYSTSESYNNKRWSYSTAKNILKEKCFPMDFSYITIYLRYDGFNPILGMMYNAGKYVPKDYSARFKLLCAPAKEMKFFDSVTAELIN